MITARRDRCRKRTSCTATFRKRDLSGRIEKTDGGEHDRDIGESITLGHSVIGPFVNPHRLGIPSPFKAVLLLELDRSPVGHKNVLMEASILQLHVLHYPSPNATPLIHGKYKQVWVVHD